MKQIIRQIFTRLNMTASRGVLTGTNDNPSIQEVQVKALAGEKFDKVQRFQQFGFSSVPEEGDVIILCPQGLRDRAMVICVQDLKHRPKGLKSGDSVMYDAHQNIIKLNKDGITIESPETITIKAAKKVNIEASDDVTIESASNINLNAANTLNFSATSMGMSSGGGGSTTLNINANVNITGSLTASSDINLNGSVKINGQTQIDN